MNFMVSWLYKDYIRMRVIEFKNMFKPAPVRLGARDHIFLGQGFNLGL